MPFVAHKVELKAMAGGTGLSVSLRKPMNGPAKMSVHLSTTTAARRGWEKGDKIEVLVGTDEQHGLIRLRKNNSDGTAEVQERNAGRRGAYFSIALGRVPGFVDRTESKRYCQFEDVDGWTEVILPKWADETHPTMKSVRAPGPLPRSPVIVERRPPLGQRTRPVPIAGDPPRERSALNNRGQTAAELATLRRTEAETRVQSESITREIRRQDAVNLRGRPVTLSPTDRKVLAVLMDGQHQSIADIAERIGVAKSSVQPYVSNLRRKLKPMGMLVETISGGFAMKPEMAAKAREFLSAPA